MLCYHPLVMKQKTNSQKPTRGAKLPRHSNEVSRGKILSGGRRERANVVPSAQATTASSTSKPILTMRAVPNPPSHNSYGYERIHFLQFNYDGKGTALVRFDNEPDLWDFGGSDLKMILLGDPMNGDRWYRPE